MRAENGGRYSKFSDRRDGRPWVGAASTTVRMQAPLLRPYFEKIDECFPATINLLLETPLEVRLPDIVTPPIAWGGPSSPGERFGITRIELELLPGQTMRHEAWIYTAEQSPHRFHNDRVELLARRIEGIEQGLRCRIWVDRVIPLALMR
jgi:hypothetical protein